MPTLRVLDIQNNVLRLLNENANTPALNLETGVGGTAALSLADAMIEGINNAAADMARSCWYLPLAATYTSLPIGTRSVVFSAGGLSTGGTGQVWAAQEVSWNATPLTPTTLSELGMRFSSWRSVATGTPTKWYPDGKTGVGLYKRPTLARDLIIYGPGIPPEVTDTADIIDWLPKDLIQLLEFYVAQWCASKNLQNPGLRERAGYWAAQYNQGVAAQLAALWQSDENIANLFYPRLPQKA